MAEIKTPLIDQGEGSWLITKNHSLADVVRWLIAHAGGAEEIRRLVEREAAQALCGDRSCGH